MLESSPRTRDRTPSALGLAAWSLGYWTTREVPLPPLESTSSLSAGRALLHGPLTFPCPYPVPTPGSSPCPRAALRAGAEAREKERKWDSGPHCGRKARIKKQTGPWMWDARLLGTLPHAWCSHNTGWECQPPENRGCSCSLLCCQSLAPA